VNDPKIVAGQKLDVYSSYNGSTWTNENKSCITTQTAGGLICSFSVTHLTLFAIGTTQITWNNMEFITQDFRDSSPTSGDILDAFFGT